MVFPTNEQLQENLEIQFDDSIQSRARPIQVNMPDATIPADNIYNGGLLFNISTISDNIPQWSIYPARRDRALRAFWKAEPIMSGAIYSVAAKIKSLNWKLLGLEELQPEAWAMMDSADLGGGMSGLLNKCMIDYCTQDNGFFIEKVGAGNPDSPLVGPTTAILHLDSAQCWRTFDPDYPVMYIDPINGTRHRMHRTRIVSRSSMTQPNELARGIGYSPLSRALLSVKTMRSIMEYRYEKASGAFQRGIIFGKGLTNKTLESLMQGNQLNAESEGLTRISNMPAYVTINGVELDVLDLASIPDNWDTMNETQLYVYIVALCFGVDAREFWAVQQSGATKGDAAVQHMKSQGKGVADLLGTIEELFNNEILPDGMTLEADFIDDEHDREKADKDSIIANTLSRIKADGAIDAIEERALLIFNNVIDPETLEGAREMPGMADFVTAHDENQAMMQAQMQQNGVNPDGTPANPEKPTTDDSSEEETESAAFKGMVLVPDIRLYTPRDAITTRLLDNQGMYYGQKDKAGYGASLRAVARGYWNLELTLYNAIDAMDSSIARHYTQAFREGFASEGFLPDEISVEDRSTLVSLIQIEKQYVVQFFEWVTAYKLGGGTITGVFDRLKMWINRYDMIYAKGKLLAAGDKKLMWKFNPLIEKHCIDCLRLNGRVYRAKIWDKYNIAPQSPNLACFGAYCGCEFVPTSEPITRGRPPALTGRKAIGAKGLDAFDAFIKAIEGGTYSDSLLLQTQKIIESDLIDGFIISTELESVHSHNS